MPSKQALHNQSAIFYHKSESGNRTGWDQSWSHPVRLRKRRGLRPAGDAVAAQQLTRRSTRTEGNGEDRHEEVAAVVEGDPVRHREPVECHVGRAVGMDV